MRKKGRKFRKYFLFCLPRTTESLLCKGGNESRSKPVVRGLLFLLVLIIVFFVIDFGLSFSLFKVKRIICFEEGFPCQQERLKIFEDFYDKNIFSLKTSSLSHQVIQKRPEILKLEVKKQLPDTLKIKVIKREPVVYLTADQEKFFLSDVNGVIFQGPLKDTNSYRLPLIIFPTGSVDFRMGLSLENYQSFKEALKLQQLLKEFFINFDRLKIENEEDLSLSLPDGIVVTFSAKKELKPQVASLQLILKQSKMEGNKIIKKIDLRFEKPVIKL